MTFASRTAQVALMTYLLLVHALLGRDSGKNSHQRRGVPVGERRRRGEEKGRRRKRKEDEEGKETKKEKRRKRKGEEREKEKKEKRRRKRKTEERTKSRANDSCAAREQSVPGRREGAKRWARLFDGWKDGVSDERCGGANGARGRGENSGRRSGNLRYGEDALRVELSRG